MKPINILGDTQREQWHIVVNMLRQLGGALDYKGRDELCCELDRYIDAMEDANEADETVYVLTRCVYSDFSGSRTEAFVFRSSRQAYDEMVDQYKGMAEIWNYDEAKEDGFKTYYRELDNNSACIGVDCDGRCCSWKISPHVI